MVEGDLFTYYCTSIVCETHLQIRVFEFLQKIFSGPNLRTSVNMMTLYNYKALLSGFLM